MKKDVMVAIDHAQKALQTNTIGGSFAFAERFDIIR